MLETQLTQIKGLIKDGEYLSAYDLASQLLAQHPQNERLIYYSILSLARSGAVYQAQGIYKKSTLPASDNEDYLSLGARLAKDSALNSPAADRKGRLEEAAKQYEYVFQKTGGDYPAVNAATLYRLSGNDDKARSLANTVLDICAQHGKRQQLEEYYRLVTIAEANLVLGKTQDIQGLLAEATQHIGDDWSARSITRRQLGMLLPAADRDSLLQPLASPSVIHYCGHLITSDVTKSRFKPDNEALVMQSIQRELDRLNVGFGYGSLASGADILFAEALLSRNAHLHVILPFNTEEFINISVRPAGENWVSRFEECLRQASSISYATEDSYLNDISLFHYASRLGMGLAIQKSRALNAESIQLAIWDTLPATSIAGTAADIYYWQQMQLPSLVINCQTGETLAEPFVAKPPVFIPPHHSRHPMAMLFGDIKGFSKLTDCELLVFVEHVLGTISRVLQRFNDSIVMKNTWGDGIFIVLNDTLQAAECALLIQEALKQLDLDKIALPRHISIRIGAHYGPVYALQDPVLGSTNYFGSHVSKAARIEPVTPPGEVYVTRQFAAEISMNVNAGYTTEYVGNMPAAKSYGNLPMYALRKNYRD